MLLQAAGLALLAALSPAALLISAVYLGSARPRPTSVAYLAGATLMSTVIAIAGLVLLRGVGLSRPDHHGSRYGLRLGLGLLLLAVALVARARHRRRRAQPRARARRPGLLSRMTASPSPRSAFVTGLVVFAPGLTFLAALQVIATARASIEITALGVALIVVLDVILVWLPLALFLVAPGLTRRRLKAFNGWLRAHGSALLTVALFAAGTIMAVDGAHGLIAGH